MSNSNLLIHETSPYLLQHAYNPVNWYPWSEEALNHAKEQNKPILVSIGYSACHWCHVMERESFENEGTARIMNEHFVNIKIDREERPDLDHIYMDAVQAMTGSGGWPLNVFLTPDGKPFYGGTYFPPQPAFNRPSWQDVLLGVSQAFTERRHEINAQAENLTDHLVKSNAFGSQKSKESELFTKDSLQQAFDNIMKTADREWGGFGRAPKFPQTFTVQYLLRYHHVTGNKDALNQAILSLDKMIEGGIYDQIGGGFARYSTDTEWLAPHFEKMLYDNALLVSVISEAYQLTKKERYKEVIEETLSFVQRELLHSSGGFYSALDADSEGEEGRFYVWSYDEINTILKKDAALFCEYYDVTEKGNWEETNILRVKEPLESFAGKKNKLVPEIEQVLDKGRKELLGARSRRIRPGLDDKIILGWNALMNTACCKAFIATGDTGYKRLAVDNMEFLLERFSDSASDGFYHTWKNDKAKFPAFLDDYAFLIQALLHLQEITTETRWLDKAAELTSFVIDNFSEEDTGFFFYTASHQKDVIVRKKEVYDGAVPSGNSIMAYNLQQLGILLDRQDWSLRSERMLLSIGQAVTRYPGSFGVWVSLMQEKIMGTNEIAIIGKDHKMMLSEMFTYYIPHRVLMASEKGGKKYPLLSDKPDTDITNVYLCKDYVCQRPLTTVKALISLIHRGTEP